MSENSTDESLTWPDLEHRVAAGLSTLPDESFLILGLPKDSAAGEPYVQFAHWIDKDGAHHLHAEAAGSENLAPGPPLTQVQERLLEELGWRAPVAGDTCRNWAQGWPQPAPFEPVAELVGTTLRTVYGVGEPSELRYACSRWEGGDIALDLGLEPIGHSWRPAAQTDGELPREAGARPMDVSRPARELGQRVAKIRMTDAVRGLGFVDALAFEYSVETEGSLDALPAWAREVIDAGEKEAEGRRADDPWWSGEVTGDFDDPSTVSCSACGWRGIAGELVRPEPSAGSQDHRCPKCSRAVHFVEGWSFASIPGFPYTEWLLARDRPPSITEPGKIDFTIGLDLTDPDARPVVRGPNGVRVLLLDRSIARGMHLVSLEGALQMEYGDNFGSVVVTPEAAAWFENASQRRRSDA